MLSTSQDTKPVHCKSILLILLFPTDMFNIVNSGCYTHVVHSVGSDIDASVGIWTVT
jgi:hypothetical protein